MPLYNYKCPKCGNVFGEYRSNFVGRDIALAECCSDPSSRGEKIMAYRAHDQEIPVMRPDIEPGFHQGVGAYITSRADLRDHLAFHNAAADLPTNGYPSAGRLHKKEREEIIESGSIPFDNKVKPRWGTQPSQPMDIRDSPIDIDVEGKADYQAVRDGIKEKHKTRKVK